MEKIYQVFMGRFCSDFKDLAIKLDYIKYLGFDSILLTPFFSSPSYHGYDCDNFLRIKDEYGNIEDFSNFTRKLEDIGMDCYMDFPVCHTSNNHPLFIESRRGENDCYVWTYNLPERDYWYATPMANCSWHQCELTSNWYLGVWGNNAMPSLNIHSVRVKEELLNMFKYWLSFSDRLHVRLDAILYWDVIYATALEHCYWLKNEIDKIRPNIKIIGEVWDNNVDIVQQFAKALGSCFSFVDASEIKSVACSNKEYKQIGEDNLVYFCSNHDQTRLMNSCHYDVNKVKRALDMLYTTKGRAIVIYYGDEIGVTGEVFNLDHTQVRQPLNWNDIMSQMLNPDSLLNHVKNLNYTTR